MDRASRFIGWLVLMLATPLASLAIWAWLTHEPTSSCYGLEDGASLASFVTVVAFTALRGDAEALSCGAPALLLPLIGLALVVTAREHRAVGWIASAVGFAVHALTAVALVSIGC